MLITNESYSLLFHSYATPRISLFFILKASSGDRCSLKVKRYKFGTFWSEKAFKEYAKKYHRDVSRKIL